MGRHFTLALRVPSYQRDTHKKKTNSTSISSKAGVYLLAGCLVLAVAYLVQVNSFSTKGFEIKSLQKSVEARKDENKKLGINSASLQSMDQVQNDPSVVGMIPVTSINYIHQAALTQR